MAKNDWSLIALRVVVGIIFFYHGYQKLFVAGGLPGTAQFFASVGIPSSNIMAIVVGAVEFFGGLFLIAGMLTKLSTALLIVNMSVALFAVHLKNGFSASKGGYEFVLLLIAALLVFLAKGAGKPSMGNIFKNKWLR